MLRKLVLAASGALFLGLAALMAAMPSGADTPATAAALPPLPANWPSTLQLGEASPPGGAASMKAVTQYGFRYQYLAGGVNTGNGWANWNAGGNFVTYYIQDSIANGITPVFSYYMLYQSSPGNSQGESAGIATNLGNTATMTAYYSDLKLLFQRAGAFPTKMVVLQVDPDVWGYTQQRSTGDNATTVPAKVASTGLPELAGLPENLSGFARAIVKLRDTYAPNVVLGYHLSIWGTGNDIAYSDPSDATIDALATRSGNFYKSLAANFDISFAEFSDRDAAFKQYQYGDNAAWWNAGDYARNVRYLSTFVSVAGKRVVVWQIPQGNTKMRAQNNTWDHYQDNRVEWLLDDPTRTHLTEYANAGVVAFLFGRGADGPTCACDDAGDGVTNPAPINGNDMMSYNADDDGGFYKNRTAAYYAAGAMVLPSAGTVPTATPTSTTAAGTATPTRTPTPIAPTSTPIPGTATPTRTPTVAPTATTVPAGWSSTAAVSVSSIRRGNTQRITATVTNAASATGLVDIEVYNASGQKVYQQFFDNQSFSAGTPRSYTVNWAVPSNAATGTYTVRIGVFSPGWGSLYHWNAAAATFSVRR